MTIDKLETASSDTLWSEAQCADYLGVSRAFLAQRRMDGFDGEPGPAFVRVGRGIRYRASTVNTWLASKETGAA